MPANANQQSFAIIEKRLSDDGSEASLILVKIFPDREEQFRLRLKRSGRHWKIVEMRGPKKIAPEKRFGTQVVPETP